MAADDDDLLAEFQAFTSRVGGRCSIAGVLKQLKPEDARKLHAALKCEAISHAAIVRWLASRDMKRAQSTVARHRLGQCRCDD